MTTMFAHDTTPRSVYTRTRRRSGRHGGVVFYTRPRPTDVPGTNRKIHGDTAEDRMTNKLLLPTGHVAQGTYKGIKTGTYSGDEAFLLGRLKAGWLLFVAHTRSRIDGEPDERRRFVALPPDETLRVLQAPPAYPRAAA